MYLAHRVPLLLGWVVGCRQTFWVVWKMTYTLQALGRWIDYSMHDRNLQSVWVQRTVFVHVQRWEWCFAVFFWWRCCGMEYVRIHLASWPSRVPSRWLAVVSRPKCPEIWWFFFHDTKVFFAGLGQPFYQSTTKECDEALSSQCNVHRHIN